MKFPKQHCLKTSDINHSQYCLLITKFITEGNHWISNFEKSQYYDLWDYIGTDMEGRIFLSDKPYNYMKINAWMDFPDVDFDDYPNLLTKEWVIKYLDEDVMLLGNIN